MVPRAEELTAKIKGPQAQPAGPTGELALAVPRAISGSHSAQPAFAGRECWLFEQRPAPPGCALLDVIGVGTPGPAVAAPPQPCPGLRAVGGLLGEEVMDGPGSAGKQRDEAAALRSVQAVGIDEDAQPMASVIALPAWGRRERDEPMQGVSKIPEPGPGRGGIPVDKGPLHVVDDKVPGGQVVVGNDVGARRRGSGPATVRLAVE